MMGQLFNQDGREEMDVGVLKKDLSVIEDLSSAGPSKSWSERKRSRGSFEFMSEHPEDILR